MISYVPFKCRYSYENERAVKVISLTTNKEYFIPKRGINNHVDNSFRRGEIVNIEIAQCIAKQKGIC